LQARIITPNELARLILIADLVLFDPFTITDKAMIENPKQLSKGIAGVWGNGDRV